MLDSMSRRIGKLNERFALLERMSAEALTELQEFAAFKDALEMAHQERTGQPLDGDEEIDPRDDERARGPRPVTSVMPVMQSQSARPSVPL